MTTKRSVTLLSAWVPAWAPAIFVDPPAPPPPAPPAPPAPPPAPPAPPEPPAPPAPPARDPVGRFMPPPAPEDPQALAAWSRDAHARIVTGEERIAELNRENTERRQRETALRTELTTTVSRQDALDQRLIRSEVRDSLRAANVIASTPEELDDITSAFMRTAGDKVRIDGSTGETVGIAEHLVTFKEKRAAFFKAAAPPPPPPGPPAPGQRNRTARGPAPAGAPPEPGAPQTGGMPDLRGLTRQQRQAATAEYKRSLRSPAA